MTQEASDDRWTTELAEQVLQSMVDTGLGWSHEEYQAIMTIPAPVGMGDWPSFDRMVELLSTSAWAGAMVRTDTNSGDAWY